MKCPYRVNKTIEIKHMPSNYINVKEIDSKRTENTDFEDCYEAACPCFDLKERRCNHGKLYI